MGMFLDNEMSSPTSPGPVSVLCPSLPKSVLNFGGLKHCNFTY
jgi:hypothetical protein